MSRKERVIEMFQHFDGKDRNMLESFYAADVRFEDPLGTQTGLDALADYYKRMYEPVDEIHFEFETALEVDDEVMATWVMTYTNKRLNGGEPVSVKGCSHVRFGGDRVSYHRDYFDVSEMVYDQLPLLGRGFRAAKRRFHRG